MELELIVGGALILATWIGALLLAARYGNKAH